MLALPALSSGDWALQGPALLPAHWRWEPLLKWKAFLNSLADLDLR